jgi:hypothetical protein
MKMRSLLLASAIVAANTALAFAQEPSTPPDATYKSSIPADQRHAYFGEMHLHTTMSFDAWTFGTKVTPDQALKFGRGETVSVPASQVGVEEGITGGDVQARRAWPLDFMAVTDHSESMGVLKQLEYPNSALAQTPVGKQILKNPGSAFKLIGPTKAAGQATAALTSPDVIRHAWDVEVKAANDNYEPGKFTTFIAYEWSAMPEGKYNLHRNVFFNSDHAPLPFSSNDSRRPEDLWTYLEKSRAQGIDVIAIPHNGNASGGLMYDWNDSDGRPIDEHYAQRRALNEPLTEIVQNKGQSDTAPVLSPNDEFANFEMWDHLLTAPDVKSNPNGSYIRQAFGRGLVIQAKVGVNPYKYGVVGASDFHNGLSASDENAFASLPYGLDPNTMVPKGDAAKRALGIIKSPALVDLDALANNTKPRLQNLLEFSGAGITGVWAEENTRNSIFAALKRKETFATSGTRIRVRVFGGWNFDSRIVDGGDWVAKAYADGVPMGGDLPAKPETASAPRFILQAEKDPDGANLDRVQVIKIWLEGTDYKEKIFDVALSDNRKTNSKTGHAPDVGNTVDLKTGAYKNSIGAAILTTVWHDPEFDAAKPAVYYARVLEIPTPRWSTLLAIKNNLPIPTTVASTIQERAWSSPIWYTPATL